MEKNPILMTAEQLSTELEAYLASGQSWGFHLPGGRVKSGQEIAPDMGVNTPWVTAYTK